MAQAQNRNILQQNRDREDAPASQKNIFRLSLKKKFQCDCTRFYLALKGMLKDEASRTVSTGPRWLPHARRGTPLPPRHPARVLTLGNKPAPGDYRPPVPQRLGPAPPPSPSQAGRAPLPARRGLPGPCRGRRPPRRGSAAAPPPRSRSAPEGGCPLSGAAWLRGARTLLPAAAAARAAPPPPSSRPLRRQRRRPRQLATHHVGGEPRGPGRARRAARQDPEGARVVRLRDAHTCIYTHLYTHTHTRIYIFKKHQELS